MDGTILIFITKTKTVIIKTNHNFSNPMRISVALF